MMGFDPVSYAMGAKSGGGGGSGGGVLVVHDVDGTLDKTWQEIADADCVVCQREDDRFILYAQRTAVYPAEFVVFLNVVDTNGFNTLVVYQATSADGYPAQTQ